MGGNQLADPLDVQLAIPEAVLAQPLGEEMVLLQLDTGTYFGLDAMGALVWHHVQRGQSLRAIHQLLCEAYEAPAERIARDLAQLVAHLRQHRLVNDA